MRILPELNNCEELLHSYSSGSDCLSFFWAEVEYIATASGVLRFVYLTTINCSEQQSLRPIIIKIGAVRTKRLNSCSEL